MRKAICFDLDGVYFTRAGKAAFHAELVRLTGDDARVSHALYLSPEMARFTRGQMSEHDFWNYMRSDLQLQLADRSWRTLWAAGYAPDPQVQDLIHLLHDQRHLICTISNNNPARIQALQERFHFFDDFDVRIFSYEVGAVKPEKRIFQVLIDRLDMTPSDIIYADDNPSRIKGAHDLGITTFVYQGIEHFRQELVKRGFSITR